MAISIQNVSKKFGNQMALSNVSLEVPPAQVLGLLGPNGAGKSTLMRLISGYFPATDGTVSVCGFDVLGQPMEARSCVGYLPEHNPIHTDMYVREYLEYTAGLHGIKDVSAAVSSMIEKVGLTPESHKLIGQLSKGYRQRVGIAQALIHDPKVLILDEPTSGVDVNGRDMIRAVIKNLASTGCAVVLATHELDEAERCADDVVIFHQAKLVANGSLESIRSQSYEIRFRSGIAFDVAALAKYLDFPIQNLGEEYVIMGTADAAVIGKFSEWMSFHGADIRDLRAGAQRLEDIFRRLTTGGAQ